MSSVDFNVTLSVTEKGKNAPQYSIGSDLNGDQSLEDLIQYVKEALVTIAYNTLVEEQAKGFDKNPLIDVDGVRGKRVDEVKPFGKIFFTARASAPDFLVEAYDLVVSRSPSKTGTYKKYNWVLYNGALVAEDEQSLASWVKTAAIKAGDVIRFVNITPYASRLERLAGTSSGGKQRLVKSKDKAQRSGVTLPGNSFKSILGANGAYYLSVRALKRKYSKNAKISFAFFSGKYLALPAIANPKTGKAMRRNYIGKLDPSTGTRGPDGDPYLYPCVVIKFGDGSGFV